MARAEGEISLESKDNALLSEWVTAILEI